MAKGRRHDRQGIDLIMTDGSKEAILPLPGKQIER
jgi:hypothetical protein